MNEPPRTLRPRLFSVFGLLGLAYAGLVALLAGCQRHLIYFPSKAAEPMLRAQAGAAGLEAWEDAEGNLIGWKSAHRPGSPLPAQRLLVFHGNAGAAVHRSYFRDGFASVDRNTMWEVYLFEYPGYGARPGKPGEAAFLQAGEAALHQLWQTDDRPVHLLGESLGGGVACQLAGEFPERVAGVLLITPFTRLADVGAHHYPIVPVRLILRDRYDNVQALQRYRGPVAVVVAGRDEVIPAEFGKRLHDGYAGPKRLWVQEAAQHNTLDVRPGLPWWREVSAFLLQNVQ